MSFNAKIGVGDNHQSVEQVYANLKGHFLDLPKSVFNQCWLRVLYIL